MKYDRVEIIFTPEVIRTTRRERLRLGINTHEELENYRGPVFEHARYNISNGVVSVAPADQRDTYHFPLHTIGRIKTSR